MGHSLAALKTLDESYPDSTDHQPHPWEISYCRSKLAQSLSTEFIPPLHLTGLTSFQLPDPSDRGLGAFHPDRQRVIRNEIDKLLEAGFIREVSYPDWLANVVWPLVEVYIDDIVVKSKTREQHILHLQEVFYLLRKYGMKLNPSKCAFGVSAGKFLGFMVSQRGIEVSPDQVKAVMETPPPRNKKELQRLTGKLVALGRFIARFTDELRPFFLAYEKLERTGGQDNCQNALEN
ncbi:Transposon Tf2-2 polyprotein [Vitis vinifera]|uniref:Transposon Tf2-2 polyprotein n=1 Tax=Vitis vinifera TaxID=29760 RepID=A0A438CL16_VITVI|nr:Transposon Tf2-2 polyprotein [Vitis vinifera]